MSSKDILTNQIERASDFIAPVPPLKSFSSTNPLACFESLSFFEAIKRASSLFGGRGLPSRFISEQAFSRKKVCPEILKKTFEHRLQLIPKSLEHLEQPFHKKDTLNPSQISSTQSHLSKADYTIIKYLAAFLDEGQSSWEMPDRELGFYKCWKSLAAYDKALSSSFIQNLPSDPLDAIELLLKETSEEQREEKLKAHLIALPGWAGFVKWRSSQIDYLWQKAYPITIADYLAVRLATCKMLGHEFFQEHSPVKACLEELCWLESWEMTYRSQLLKNLKLKFQTKLLENDSQEIGKDFTIKAQLIFCIDARSEVIRRHIEKVGLYETLGCAGFFSLPMKFTAFGSKKSTSHCPSFVSPKFQISELPSKNQIDKAHSYLKRLATYKTIKKTLRKLKAQGAASFVSTFLMGLVMPILLTWKTFLPQKTKAITKRIKSFLLQPLPLAPDLHSCSKSSLDFTIEEQSFYAESMLKNIGLTSNFAPLVILCGHRSESVNNSYASAFNCGACGGNHGGPNARVMSSICNHKEVRSLLRARGINIPDHTRFIAAEHNTTTDEIELFSSFENDENYRILKADLKKASLASNIERSQYFEKPKNGFQRSSDWAEPRPEWGLARHASLIIGKRSLTKSIDLEGRSFLHSYDWTLDSNEKSLESILTGSFMVVFGINMQYYFSTIDNATYGSGLKATQNIVSKIGVVQSGCPGDLRRGLPLEAVMLKENTFFHEPLRLTTIIQAPVQKIEEVFRRNPSVQRLFDNQWAFLVALDPISGRIFSYKEKGVWEKFE